MRFNKMNLLKYSHFYSVAILIVFVLECSSDFLIPPAIHSENKAPPPKPAPIHLTQEQYKHVKERRLSVNIIHIPTSVVQIRIWTIGNKTLGKNEIHNVTGQNTRHYYMPELDMDKGEHMMLVTLITQESVCGTKPIIIIRKANEIHNLPWNIGNIVDEVWVENCSEHSCMIEVDWQNFCGEKNEEKRIKYKISQYIGGEISFTCKLDKEETSIQWRQMYQNRTNIVTVPNTYPSKYKLIIIVEEFDNNTIMECFAPYSLGTSRPTLIQIPEEHATPKVAANKFPVIHYNNYTNIDYQCSENITNTPSTYTALIQDKEIRIIESLQNLPKTYNGSTICCLYFKTNTIKNKALRYVKNKSILIYNDKENPETSTYEAIAKTPKTKLESSDSQQDQKVYYYIGGALAGICCLLLILFIIKKRYYKTSRKPVDTNNDITNSRQVLYADLDLSSLPRGDRKSAHEESPYAQVINPDTVLYVQLDLQDGNSIVRDEETPYAQIMKSVSNVK